MSDKKGTAEVSESTLLAQAGHYIDKGTGGVVPPIYLATTYARDENYELMGDYIYGRYQNPTYDQVEKLAAQLDNGAEALVFASGMAAITAVFETLESGAHIVAPMVMYHGAQDWLRRISEKRNIGLTLFDQQDPAALQQAIIPGKTALVWIETPVNPTWMSSILRRQRMPRTMPAPFCVWTPRFLHRLPRGRSVSAQISFFTLPPSISMATATLRPAFWQPGRKIRFGKKSNKFGNMSAGSWAHFRRGCCCEGCGRFRYGLNAPAKMH